MRFTDRILPIIKELTEIISTEMTLCSSIVIYYTSWQCLFVCLSLEDLFFKCTGSDEAVYEAILLLSVTPYTGQSLLISCWIPVCEINNWVRASLHTEIKNILPGSNSTRRFAPMRLIPQPPALLDSKKTNSFPSGSLNWSTSFWRFLILVLPSRRK